MRLFSKISVVAMGLLLTVQGVARAAEAPMKIGYVDIQLAMTTVEQGKRESEKIKKELESKKKKFDAMESELKKLKEDFDKQAPMMKDDVRGKKQSELQAKFEAYQQAGMELQKEVNEKQNSFIKEIFGKMKTIIEKLGDRDNYTLILDRNETNVLFYKRHMDVTDEVVKMYNAQYK